MSRKDYERAPTIPEFGGPADPSTESKTVRVDDERRRKLRHDLRSPLNQIIGFSELLQEDAVERGDLESFVLDLKKIENAARRMVPLIDELAALHTQPQEAGATRAVSRRPLHRPTTGSPRVDQKRSAPPVFKKSLHKGKVLAVDDDPMNREMVARRLRLLGYEVATAEDGPSALERIEKESFDLVLLDVVMPDVSGLVVLETVRAQYDRGDLPIIMTTALDASTDVVEALRLGANDYVTKPLDMAIVVARIDTQLGLKQARDKVRELNLRLEAAQNRVASLADHGAANASEPGALARQIGLEIGEAIGNVEVAVWLFSGDHLESFSDSKMTPPSASELEWVRANGRAYRDREGLLSIASPSGKLFGVIGVAIGHDAFGESEEHVVQNFARHLGSTLELGEMRKELARTAEQRRATHEQLVARGIDILHLCATCKRCYPHTVEQCEADETQLNAMSRPVPYRVRQRYRLERLVGEGGMGTVFRAKDERLQRDVAVKLIKADLFHNDTVRLRFEQEARAVAKIDHPSVIAIYDSGEAEEGSLYMVMEWLHGQDLGQVLDAQGPGSPKQIVSVLRQVAGALEAAHSKNLVHRDIKPDNIFVHSSELGLSAKILDFGVAKEMSASTHLTQTGSLVGTPLYMSPEQVMNRPVDARSDIYSLASVAFEALTGFRTVEVEHFTEVVLAVAGQDAPRLSTRLPGVPQELDEAFARGLEKSPKDRPSSVIEWVDGFAGMLEELSSPNHWQL